MSCATSRRSPTRSASGAIPTCTSTPWRRSRARCSPPSARGVETLTERLRERQAHGNVVLAQALEDAELGELQRRLHGLADAADREAGAVKARKVKDLEPAGALADNAERIVIVRLDELGSFMPKATDPREVVALHDMRIAAKRLRYILEITAPCFGPYAKAATKLIKDLQDLLGEIHDCDVQIPEVTEFLKS